MYKIRQERKQELLKYKQKYYAEKIGVIQSHISKVMTKGKCTEMLAKCIVSICHQIAIDDVRMEELIEYYFTREEK